MQVCASVDALEPTTSWFTECDAIIDALIGIGAKGPMREPVASLIDRMNQSGKPIVAAHIPSGLDADTGLPQGTAIRAAVTVAFGLPKQGCFLREGPAHTRLLVVDPISLPPELLRTPHPLDDPRTSG